MKINSLSIPGNGNGCIPTWSSTWVSTSNLTPSTEATKASMMRTWPLGTAFTDQWRDDTSVHCPREQRPKILSSAQRWIHLRIEVIHNLIHAVCNQTTRREFAIYERKDGFHDQTRPSGTTRIKTAHRSAHHVVSHQNVQKTPMIMLTLLS